MAILLPSDPPLVLVPVTQVLWRVHPAELGALWFGPGEGKPPRHRFDAPGGEYGTCYFAATLGVTVLETMVRGRRVPVIAREELQVRSVSSVALAQPLRMIQLEGKGLAAFGVGAHEVSGDDYRGCQDFFRRVHQELPEVDGIQYRSRWDTSEICWAVFDRARSRLGEVLGTQPLEDTAVLPRAAPVPPHPGIVGARSWLSAHDEGPAPRHGAGPFAFLFRVSAPLREESPSPGLVSGRSQPWPK